MKLTPIIVPPDWSGASSCYNHLLLNNELPGTPLIAYGEDNASQTSYVLENDIKSDNQIQEIHKEAILNLQNRESLKDCELGVKISGGLDPYYMRCADDLTASDILNKDLMLKIHSDLNSDTLYVAIPNKSTLLIGSNQDDIAAFAEDHYLDSEKMNSVPVTADVFKIIKGEIKETSVSRNKEFYTTSLIPRAQMFMDGKGGALQIGVHFVNTQLLLERVTLAMDAYSHVFSENKDFGGNIYFQVMMQKSNEEIVATLKKIEDRIQNFIDSQNLRTVNGDEINIFLEVEIIDSEDDDEIEDLEKLFSSPQDD